MNRKELINWKEELPATVMLCLVLGFAVSPWFYALALATAIAHLNIRFRDKKSQSINSP